MMVDGWKCIYMQLVFRQSSHIRPSQPNLGRKFKDGMLLHASVFVSVISIFGQSLKSRGEAEWW